MKNLIKIISVLVLMLVMTSCDSHGSLQKYYVDSQEKNEFISFDIPASIIELKDTDVSEETKNTLASIKKVNLLALKITERNKDLYDVEKEKINKILENPKYKELVKFNKGKSSVKVWFLGEEDAIDEVIVFASDKEKGLGLARVLGNKMNPSKIIKLVNDVNVNAENLPIGELKQVFGDVN